jgi:hypothetical protein
MGVNSTDTAYNFGQLGSIFTDGVNAIKPPAGKVFVAITFLADTTVEAHGGLVAEQDSTGAGLEYISTQDANGDDQTAHDIAHDGTPTALSGTGGLVVDHSNTFPKGITIYGRWTEIHPATGGPLIAYIGN